MEQELTKYTRPLAPSPFSVVKDVVNSGREMIRSVANPVPKTPELQNEMRQSLIPEEAEKIKKERALESGAIYLGNDTSIDITGFVGSLKNVGRKVSKEVEKKAMQYLKGHFNLSGDIADVASKELKNLKLTDYDEIADYFKSYASNKEPVTLYRGIQKGEAEGLLPDRPTAWTRLREVARMHTYDDGKVIKIKANPDQIMLDVNDLPIDKFPKGVSPLFDEEEIILKPLKKASNFQDRVSIKKLTIPEFNNGMEIDGWRDVYRKSNTKTTDKMDKDINYLLADKNNDLEPILIRQDGRFLDVEDGHHRVASYLAAGREDIPFKKVAALVPIMGMDQFTQPLTQSPTIQGKLPRNNESENELSVERLKGEVAFRETGSSKDPYTTTGVTGDLGKYQVNPTTLKSYSKKFLGKEVTPDQFLKNPELQERFFENGMQHLSNLGAKSLDAFLMLWHEGWGNVDSERLGKLRKLNNVKKYLNNRRDNV